MSKGWKYVHGDWNILCDVCNIRVKASTTRQRWDGFRVCENCFEIRHPQDFVKATTDHISVPFSRPRGTDTFVPVTYVSYPSEILVLDEILAKDAVKTVPNVVITGGSTLDESLGMQFLGEAPLAGSGTGGGYTNELYLSETVSISIGRTVSPSDTLSISESVSVNHIYNQSLGSNALATITLG